MRKLFLILIVIIIALCACEKKKDPDPDPDPDPVIVKETNLYCYVPDSIDRTWSVDVEFEDDVIKVLKMYDIGFSVDDDDVKYTTEYFNEVYKDLKIKGVTEELVVDYDNSTISIVITLDMKEIDKEEVIKYEEFDQGILEILLFSKDDVLSFSEFKEYLEDGRTTCVYK